SEDPSVQELLTRTHGVVEGARSHADLPFASLVEHLHLERDMSRNPLFQVMFVKPEPTEPPPQFASLTVSQYAVPSDIEILDLTLLLIPSAEGLEARFSYSTDLFAPATIDRMMGHYQMLLESACSNPGQTVSKQPLLPPEERDRLLVEW